LANVRGAALITLVALGRLRVDQIPDRVEIRQTFTPQPAIAPEYETLFREFVTLYKQTKGIFKRLNRF
jgi:xylulokinase